MMESILGRRGGSQKSSIAALSIELFPEFGWSIGDNERAFGPGTLFQGYVIVRCNEFSTRATSLRLVFQGVEAMLTYDMGPGVMRSHTSQLFSVRSVLWKKADENDVLNAMTTYKFLFTIQMPMVQFPPSMNHDYYRCTYKLSAYLDPSLGYGEIPVMKQIHIKYIPLTETRLLKTPIYLEDLKKKKKSNTISAISTSVKLYSIEYMSGGTIQATICVTRNSNNSAATTTTAPLPSSLPPMADLSITMYLYQVSKFNLDEEPILVELVATQNHLIKNANDENGQEQLYQVSMKLNESLPPSFEYSKIMALSYKLKIKIHLKKSKTSTTTTTSENGDNSNTNTTIITTTTDHLQDGNKKKNKKKFKKLLVLPWSTAISVFETPIVIATMGQGIRAGDELKDYSEFDNDEGNPLPIPRFIKNIEYEDALPKYEATRLPSYGDPTSRSVRSFRSNRSTSIASAVVIATATPSITSARSVLM